jgi:L-lactate permease
MSSRVNVAALESSLGVGVLVFLACMVVSFAAGMAGAFLGSSIALAVLAVLVQFPLWLFHLPHFNGALYASIAWAIMAAVITYAFSVLRASRDKGEVPHED